MVEEREQRYNAEEKWHQKKTKTRHEAGQLELVDQMQQITIELVCLVKFRQMEDMETEVGYYYGTLPSVVSFGGSKNVANNSSHRIVPNCN